MKFVRFLLLILLGLFVYWAAAYDTFANFLTSFAEDALPLAEVIDAKTNAFIDKINAADIDAVTTYLNRGLFIASCVALALSLLYLVVFRKAANKRNTYSDIKTYAVLSAVCCLLTFFKQDEIEGNAEYAAFNLVFVQGDSGSKSMQEGVIFKQEPAEGTQVKAGATITLYVHVPTPNISLSPDVHITGMHKDEARQALEAAGFTVLEAYRSSDTIPADHVISININKGQAYPYGTEVTMVVSTGE